VRDSWRMPSQRLGWRRRRTGGRAGATAPARPSAEPRCPPRSDRKWIRHLGTERVALRKEFRCELVQLPVLREVKATAGSISNLQNDISGHFPLDSEIPLRAIRRDVAAIPKTDRLPEQRAQTQRGSRGPVEAVGIRV